MVVRRKFMHPGQKPSPSRLLLISLHESTIASLTAIKHPFFRPGPSLPPPSPPIHHRPTSPPLLRLPLFVDSDFRNIRETTYRRPLQTYCKIFAYLLSWPCPRYAYGFNVYIIKHAEITEINGGGGINNSSIRLSAC